MPTHFVDSVGVSPQAAALVALAPTLPISSLAAIERALAARLAAPTSRELREARLGLLLFMLRDQTGEMPLADRYNEVRLERARDVEEWPHSSTLIRAYGSWQTAVKAAMRLLWCGPAGRVAHTHVGKGHAATYERPEIYEAIKRFRLEHDGRWPTSTQFYEWGRQLRRLARQGGHPDPRIPTSNAVRRHFARFADAADAARAQRPLEGADGNSSTSRSRP